jgi:hypothetical protein
MDGVRNFRNKTWSWAGSTHLQIITTSRIWSSNFIQILIAVLRGSADSNQLQHKATTVPFITIHMARAIHLARPYPTKEKRNELSSFHTRSAYWEIKSINKYCELQKAYDLHDSAYHNPAEKKLEKKKQSLSTTQQQYPSTIQPPCIVQVGTECVCIADIGYRFYTTSKTPSLLSVRSTTMYGTYFRLSSRYPFLFPYSSNSPSTLS